MAGGLVGQGFQIEAGGEVVFEGSAGLLIEVAVEDEGAVLEDGVFEAALGAAEDFLSVQDEIERVGTREAEEGAALGILGFSAAAVL